MDYINVTFNFTAHLARRCKIHIFLRTGAAGLYKGALKFLNDNSCWVTLVVGMLVVFLVIHVIGSIILWQPPSNHTQGHMEPRESCIILCDRADEFDATSNTREVCPSCCCRCPR